jgi:hypothetical protein
LIEQQVENNNEKMEERLEILSKRLLSKRDAAIKARTASGIERRWIEDEDAFDGTDVGGSGGRRSMLSYATGEAYVSSNEPRRSKVVVNIIRGRCEQAEGRFSDIMLPVDDRNWGLKATPVPMLAGQTKMNIPVAVNGEPVMDDDGAPVTLSGLAKSEMSIAKDKMEGMEAEIDDQLTECSFNAECRKVIRDAVIAGTGVLKGPSVIKRTRKSWRRDDDAGAFVMEVVEEHRPFSRRVDYWNVFPDPYCGDDIKKASYIWERDYILPRELQRLIGVDGYLSGQISAVLDEKPMRRSVAMGGERELVAETLESGDRESYEVWEYNGDLNSDDLEAMGCDCEGMSGLLSACVVFVNERPIKAVLNTLDTGDLPYDFFVWTPVSGSVWGLGEARKQQWIQRVITASWRAMMDNAGDSSGANIVISEGLEPADGKWELTGKKLWRYTGDLQDVNKAFAQFQITNNQVELQSIIDLALKFSDIESSMPLAFPQEPMGPPETLGAVELKIDSSNVAIRMRVKTWDDQVTRPHLSRYYHWNMQYSENDDIKGDFEVDPRGTSILLQRERASQMILQLMQLRSDPLIGAIIDWKRAVKQMLSANKVDILKSDEEIEQIEQNLAHQSQQQTDPGLQIAQIKTEGDLSKEKMRQETSFMDIQSDIQQAELRREHEKAMKEMDFQIEMMRLAQKENITLQEIKAMLSKESMKLNVQREIATQVARPSVEPPGRAPNGKAFPL